MRRADRLFQLLQILRRGRVVTAEALAAELEVSPRTVYRDMAALAASRVPVEGESGVGYLLRDGYDLPPLMFTIDEIEALTLGARIVASWADPALARAATDVIAKVGAVVPADRRGVIETAALWAPADHSRAPVSVDLTAVRLAIRHRNKLRFGYRDAADIPSGRTIWPLALLFYGPVWLLSGWCELREDFRSFRLDRMTEAEVLNERFRPVPGRRVEDFMRREEDRRWHDHRST